MSVKVLVTQVGQQLIADTKQIENKDTNAVVGYWLSNPRTVSYSQDEEGNVGVNFGPYCLVSDEAEFSLRAEHVVAILEPRADVAEGYTRAVYPDGTPEETTEETTEEPIEDGTDTADTEGSDDTDSTDGAA